jgi:hypothetical protein
LKQENLVDFKDLENLYEKEKYYSFGYFNNSFIIETKAAKILIIL